MRDPLPRLSVRVKLVLMFVGMGLIAYGLGGFLISNWAGEALEREILARLDYQCRAYAAALDAHLGLLARRSEDFASDGLIRDAATRLGPGGGAAGDEGLRAELRRHLALNKLPLEPAFSNLGVTGPDGRPLVAVHDEGPDLAALAGAGDVARGLDVSGLISPPGDDGRPSLLLSTPLRHLDGSRVVGRLAVLVDAWDWLAASVSEVGAAGHSPAGAAGASVDLVLHDRDGQRLLAALDGQGLPGPLRVGEPGAPPAGAHGDWAPLRGTYARGYPLSAGGWTLEVTLDAGAAVLPLTSLRSSFMGIGLLLVGLSSLLLFFPLRFVAQPLTRLTRAAERLREGESRARVPVESEDEIGGLARAFNGMADAIEERTARLEAAAEELRARQGELRAGRDRLQAVISSMQDALVVLDARGNVVLSNAAATPLLDLVRRGDLAHGHHECRDEQGPAGQPEPRAAPAGAAGCFACLLGAAAPARSCLVDVGARTFEIHTTAMPASAGGGRVLVSREVTDRIQRDERDIHNERLAVLGEVAAVMAHEINNPLASISMFNQMLAADLPADSPLREGTEVIRRNTEAATRAIRELLDYATGASPEVGPVDLHDTLGDVARFLRPLSERAGVAVRLELGATRPVVTGDEVQLRQVFVNLTLNAIQAVAGRPLQPGSGGAARAAAGDGPREVLLVTRDAGERLEVDVSDTGPGIPPENRERIFRPFFTTKARGEGTGLGLPTTRRLTEMHGGSLELVESSPAGTTFRVALRVRAATGTPARGGRA